MFPDLTRDDVFRLETRRLWLRWPKASDAPALVALAGDPAVAAWSGHAGLPQGRSEALTYILAARQRNAGGEALALALATRARPDEPIGAVSLVAVAPAVAELGVWLAAGHQGQGYGAEAIEAMVSLAFGLTGVDAVEGPVDRGEAAGHAGAGRAFTEIGFEAQPNGRLRLTRARFQRVVAGRAAPLPAMRAQPPAEPDSAAAQALAFAAGQ